MGSCCGIAEKEAETAEGTVGGKGLYAMFGRFCGILETWPFLVVSALSLLASFLLSHRPDQVATDPADPAWIALVVAGLPILREATGAIFLQKRIKTSLLISTAMISCAAIGEIFAAGEVAFLMALGQALESATLRRAKKGIRKLVSLVPATARKVITCPKCLAKGEKFRDIPLSALAIGDGVRILPGETVPVDGIITEGETTVDESVMTGESIPVDKAPGDAVYSGTVNRFGAVTVRATKTGDDSSLQKLIRLVREAQAKKAPIQRTADRWAARLVPLALGIAVCAFFVVWAWSGSAVTGLLRAVTVMVVFCPCSLALATPTAIMAAIGQATKHGVIVKSGEALELMGRVTSVCLDKTGTLTTGRISVSSVETFDGSDGGEMLRLAAAAEEASGHPLAQAIVAAAEKIPAAAALSATDFKMLPGRGVSAAVDGKTVICGTATWLEENGIPVPAAADGTAGKARADGKAVVFTAVDGKAAGFIALADTIRENAAEAVSELIGTGVNVLLLTGDHGETARFVAGELGIEEVRASLLPAGKARAIEEIEAQGRTVCMVGDGINDAVALKTASVGIAMGGAGSDIAVEAADIALACDDLAGLAYLKRLSTACVKLIHFNIAFSMTVNAVAIVCSVFGMLTPVTGALVHNLSSVFVVVNAALLYDRKFR